MSNIHIRAPWCIAAGAILPPLCAGHVALRFYARHQQGISFGADDWLTIPALVLVLGMSAAILQGVAEKSIGYPTPPIKPGKTEMTTSSPQQSTVHLIYWTVELMQIPALAAIKCSFMFFYRRIFKHGNGKTFDISSLCLIILIAIWGIGFFFGVLFICPGHPGAYWKTLLDQKEQCVQTLTLHNSYGVSDVVLDFLVILFPIPLLWRLQMSKGRKIAVIGVFALGALSIVASLIRMVTYLESTAAEFKPTTDFDLLITGGAFWSFVECGVALISACLPTVFGAFRAKTVARIVTVSKKLTSSQGKSTDVRYQRSGRLDRFHTSEGSFIKLTPLDSRGVATVSRNIDSKPEPSPHHIVVTNTFAAEPSTDIV